jgi:hypothetical protein
VVDVETRTVDMYVPDCSQPEHPTLVEQLKRRDPEFVSVSGIMMIGDGGRRASDGWIFSTVTYVVNAT